MSKKLSRLKGALAVSFVIAIVLTAIPITASAGILYDGDYGYVVNDGKATITYIDNSVSGEIVVPDTLGGYSVTAIYHAGFASRNFTSVILPDGLLEIGDSAFFNCRYLENVVIPDSVTYIGTGAFEATCIKSIEISENVSFVGAKMFGKVEGFLGYTVDENNTNYTSQDGILFTKDGSKLVSYPSGKTDEAYEVPESVAVIGEAAFMECKSLKNVVLPDTLAEIGELAFFRTGLTKIDIPYGLTIINKEVFEFCEDLKEVSIPDSVTEIGYSAFSGSGIERIEIPESVVKIGSEAFGWSNCLEEITIHDTVLNFAGNPFAGTKSDFTVFTEEGSRAYELAVRLGLKYEIIAPKVRIKSVDYTVDGNKVVFSVLTSQGFNRVKVTYPDDLKSYITYSDNFYHKQNGDYIFTVEVPAVSGISEYAFDARRVDNGKYSQEYFYKTTEIDEDMVSTNIIDSSYAVEGKDVVFTVTTLPIYNRIKVAFANAVSSYISYTGDYTLDENGNTVFTLRVPAIVGATKYAFDGRKADTNKYAKDYSYITATVRQNPDELPNILSASHEISGGKIIFKVVTRAGDFNRVKATVSDNLKGSLGISSSYTVNEDGDYVWTLKTTAPEEDTLFAFDVRTTENKYLKDYFFYDIDIESTILSASHEVVGSKTFFTVVTKPGNYDRIKVTFADSLSGSIGVSEKYTVNEDGNYVWTVKAPAPSGNATYVFDLRVKDGKYIKDYFSYELTGLRPDPADSNNWNKVVNNVYTSKQGIFQLDVKGWKSYGSFMVPEDYVSGSSDAITEYNFYAMDAEDFNSLDLEYFKNVMGFTNVDVFDKTQLSYNGKTYPAYKVFSTGMGYVWFFQTEQYVCEIYFVHTMPDTDMQSIAENMMKTIRIYD